MKAVKHLLMLGICLMGMLSDSVPALNLTINVGVLLMTNSTFPVDLPRIGPAIDMGIEEVRQRYGIIFNKTTSNYDVWCYKARYDAPGHLAKLYYERNVRAVIGPACSYAVQSAGRLAEFLKVPLVTGLGDLAERNPAEKDMFETTTILSYNKKKISVSVRAILKAYNWRHTAIIYDEEEVFYNQAGPSMVNDFRLDEDFARPYDIKFRYHVGDDWKPADILTEASRHARVFILLVNAGPFRELMYHAYRLGMADGDYVYVVVQLAEIDWWGSYKNFIQNDSKDDAVKIAYESVLLVSLITPGANDTAFHNEIKLRAFRDYGYNFTKDEPVHYFITAFYEAALYLGAAYNKTSVEGGDINDGYQVARTFFGGTFWGLHQVVSLDETGTRIADFDLLSLENAERQTFQLVGKFLASKMRYERIPGVNIKWRKGLPPDEPECGFTGELCLQEDNTVQIIGGVVGGVGGLLLLAAIFANMYLSRRRANSDMRWKISWKDVVINKTDVSKLSGFSKSLMTLKTMNDGMNDDLPLISNSIGFYKGIQVYARKFKIKSIGLGRNDLQEMRQLYLLRHNNLVQFIGVSLDPGNVAALTEVCPRGSLQDVIENDGIQLDWSFRYSLINDIVQGLKYLHNSDIRIHGKLKSSNCVVDSRFMLKLTSFGPKCLFQAEFKMLDKENFNYNKLFWTAPELLRWTGWLPGTQKGDIYSFAIILQELIVRGSPFENSDLSSSEIVLRVRDGGNPPFRPDTSSVQCSKDLVFIMQQCWAEHPDERPSIEMVAVSLRKLLRSQKGNIMDNLMTRMEQYADNLESLVEERTKAYVEEKKRAEELLYRMLPISVAKQLQAGRQVEPEAYQSVTIYFSDIVGFTTLAAKSTPMDVVNMLNDLYTIFDDIIDNFQVYKVETIGDAYMVASGLPIRNGNQHVVEISNMAISIIKEVEKFEINHLRTESLRIRIGMHSGAVVAGVVGLKMPRYCLFGDTVNTASRMESNGEAMKIHISETTKNLLEAFNMYQLEFRGHIDIKGKGQMNTYWLNGRLTENSLNSMTIVTEYSTGDKTQREPSTTT